MTTELTFGTLSCGANRSVAQASAVLANRPVCVRKSAAARSVGVPAARARTHHYAHSREEYGRGASLAKRVEAAFAVAVLIGLAAVESYFIAHAALSLRAPPEPRAAAAAAVPAPPLASERTRFSPDSSRLDMLVTVGSYVASGFVGGR